jgi:methylmalonyl-CoA mutase
MAEQSIDKILDSFFPKLNKQDWEKIASQETRKKNPLETLSWYGKDNILFLPYYDEEDVTRLPLAGRADVASSQQRHKKRTWINLPVVTLPDERAANERSLNHLSHGCDGVMFDVMTASQVDLRQLMRDIEMPYCFTAFRLSVNTGFLNSFSTFVKERFTPSSIYGALFWESIPRDGSWDLFFEQCEHFKCLGLIIPPQPPAQQIADALVQAVNALEGVSSSYPFAQVFNSIAFSLHVDTSLFESIATFRALRRLWFQMAQAYGLNNYNSDDLHLHAHSPRAADGRYSPHENMLKGTFSAMAALIGGCNSLTIEADETQPQLSRWARNVSNVLREESFFEIDDPTAGAYAVECMTESIAEKAWKLFQQNVGAL